MLLVFHMRINICYDFLFKNKNRVGLNSNCRYVQNGKTITANISVDFLFHSSIECRRMSI